VSYTEARRSSKYSANFGKGEADGVIATEAANNATVGGGFIPTLVLGIPGTPPDAIILGALLVQGIKIGPTLFNDEAQTVYTFIFGLLIATVLMLPVGLMIGRYAYKSVVSFPKSLLVPTVAFMTVVGSFAIHSNINDTQMMFGLGVVAWVLNRYGFAPSPIVLGLVLGQIAEQGFVQSYLIGDATDNISGMFFGRPISIGIILAAILTLGYPFFTEWRARKRNTQPLTERAVAAEAHPTDVLSKSATPDAARGLDAGAILLAVVFAALGITAYMATDAMSPMGAVFPATISVLLVVFSIGVVVFALLRKGSPSEGGDPAASTTRRILLVIIFGLWVFLIPVLGFFVAGLAAFGTMMVLAEHESRSAKTWLIRTITAVAVVAGFWWMMADVLLLRMPMGLFF
jgi:putative tricarboxylic transport membrane protein